MTAKCWTIVALALALTCGATSVSAQRSVQAEPAEKSFAVGEMEVIVLRDGRLEIPNNGSIFGVNAKPSEVASVLRRAGKPTDVIYLDIDVLLVRTKGRVALIDAGYGTEGKSVLQESLRLLPLSPREITDILITHGHPDHVGGLVDAAGRTAFPQATIHMAAREWRFMQHEKDTRAIANAVRSQVKTFAPGQTVLPGIRSEALFGHTPGHVMYELHSKGERLLDVGDAAHSSIISLAKPEWTLAWDTDKSLGAKARYLELSRLAAKHERIFVGHFPFPGIGFIVRSGKGFKFVSALHDRPPQ